MSGNAGGGWADGYTNSIFRLLEYLRVPRQGLIGPWGHKYPHLGAPGPAIGFLQETLRWWDHWLKELDTGVMQEPMLRAWMQDSVPPTTQYLERPGRWVGEKTWPAADILEAAYPLDSSRILMAGEAPCPGDEMVEIQSPLSVGLFAGKWCSYTYAPDLPHDQREEDGGALVFESAPLVKDLEILGAPRVELELSCSQPVAMVAARLSDVAPDGKATRVTYGLFNLTHRDSHAEPKPLVPGRRYKVRVPMNNIGQNFPAGHRLRLSLSTSYWALAWPPPRPVRMRVYPAASRLVLPRRRPRPEDGNIRFEPPQGARPTHVKIKEPRTTTGWCTGTWPWTNPYWKSSRMTASSISRPSIWTWPTAPGTGIATATTTTCPLRARHAPSASSAAATGRCAPQPAPCSPPIPSISISTPSWTPGRATSASTRRTGSAGFPATTFEPVGCAVRTNKP
ncbi:CocE/NonD family hydrolase [Microbulbifer taiwanensis]|uniref:CocE/NonD family hydrolase n=1 Tax=Microbulbifer taiwanensis TaxID=986746 RepID=UPI00360D5015